MTSDTIFVANLGDSRIVLARTEDGNLIGEQLSEDHKPSLPEEKQRIKAADGSVESNRVNGFLSTSRSIGILRFKSKYEIPIDAQLVSGIPDTTVVKREPTHRFLILSSDGIWDCVSN